MTLTNFKFHGGIHPKQLKDLSRDRAIESISWRDEDEIVITLSQGIGSLNHPILSIGDSVQAKQRISECYGEISVPVHSPCDGTITAIEERPATHPSGLQAVAIVIKPDADSSKIEINKANDLVNHKIDASKLSELLSSLTAEEIISKIRIGGVIGLGGAGFPTCAKLHGGIKTNIETLIINGMECEPRITCDDRLMRERAIEIIAGVEILDHLLHPNSIKIGVEDNKPEAILALEIATTSSTSSIEIITTPTLYPSGGERQLIQLLTGKEVPSGTLPSAIGVVCQNVATVAALYHALLERPLTHRVVTVTGDGVESAGNYSVPIGIPIDSLLTQCGVVDSVRITVGGPMMGFELHNSSSPITKTVNCLIVEKNSSLPSAPERYNCIRCASCSDACPAKLMPQQLYWAAQSRDFEQTEKLNLFDCIECGCCDFVCPSKIPLVSYYRYAKGVIRGAKQEQNRADEARVRHEFHDARITREKAEKAEKLAKKRAALKAKKESNKSTDKPNDADKKGAAIRAAIKRAEAKKKAAAANS